MVAAWATEGKVAVAPAAGEGTAGSSTPRWSRKGSRFLGSSCRTECSRAHCAAHCAEASWKVVYWKEEEDHSPAMQSSLLPEVRRLQVEPSQHCAAMAVPSCVVISASWTHASVSELPSRIRTEREYAVGGDLS